MIGIIRRKFTESMNADLWNVNRSLQPEPDSTPVFRHPPADATSNFGAGYGPNDNSAKAFCKTVVETAIAQQGWYGGMRISVPWLRMTLAGLESERFAPEMMWEGVEEQDARGRHVPGLPSYDSVFESERALVQKLGLR